jgi:hypothetical protein
MLALADAAAEKAHNKRETAQKSTDRAEKRTRKKAKTAEIERRRNQENEHMYSYNLHHPYAALKGVFSTEPLAVVVAVNRRQDTFPPSAEEDPSVR